MKADHHTLTEDILLQRLKEIILKEDREELMQLKNTVNDDKLLEQRVSPYIESKLDFLQNNFPEAYHKAVNDIVEEKLKNSQQEIVSLIYPEMGKMIRKFMALQFQILKDNIDSKVRETFSFKDRLKSMFSGVKTSDKILVDLDTPEIQQIFAIKNESGLLMGSASSTDMLDKDVVAGMLTAIKSFVEDAFGTDNQGLEMIDYGTYRIFIQSNFAYYFAVALSGSLSATERNDLSQKLSAFAEKELNPNLWEDEEVSHELISNKLHHYFIKDEN